MVNPKLFLTTTNQEEKTVAKIGLGAGDNGAHEGPWENY
jgi:hypothetical protein